MLKQPKSPILLHVFAFIFVQYHTCGTKWLQNSLQLNAPAPNQLHLDLLYICKKKKKSPAILAFPCPCASEYVKVPESNTTLLSLIGAIKNI